MIKPLSHTSLRRVIVICDDQSISNALRKALHVSDDVESNLRDDNGAVIDDPSVHSSLVTFRVVHVDNWQRAFLEVKEAKEIGDPYKLVLIGATNDSWDSLRANMETIWVHDESMRCIVCLSAWADSGPMRPAPSRQDQWAIFRMPGAPEELIQLASCLTGYGLPAVGRILESSGSSASDDQSGKVSEKVENSNVIAQQAELALARDELATSKAYVNNVLSSMADSLLVIDANMTIGSVNPSLLGLLGYQENELVGQSPGLIFGEEFAQGAIIENLLLQGSVSGIESSFLTSSGQVIPISVSGSMMQDENGQFQGLVCVAQDITERKQMEEEKRQLHEQLLDTSRQLGMAEVASDVLHNVGNVLNSINVSIGVVSDLLKNSIVGDVGRISQLFNKHSENLGDYLASNPKGQQIPAYLEKLSGQLLEEQRAAIRELARLKENAQHAQHCVAMQQGVAKFTGITEVVSVVAIVEEALTTKKEALDNSRISVVREYEEIPLVIVDKRQIHEILINVVQNACEAMASASNKLLVVRARLIPGPPDSIRLEVEDSGKGIAPNELIKIFGQSYQAKDGGHGGSLHSAALMAKNLGGALRAYSDGLGQGATFSLDLPGNFHFPDL